ncbi:MAG: C40 family peptidase, partial [Spirochaetia bacterium]
GTGSNGLDCSGLIYRVYRDNGVEVPRTVRTLIHTGKRVSGSLQEGDLVFFNTFGRAPSHVGIYIGDNRFIHAASEGEETGVIISSLDKKYYNDRYLHARRIREADIPSAPPSGGFLADIARRQPRDIFSLRINSYVGLGSGGVTAERFYADFETGINIGQGRIDTALFMEGNTLSDGRTQIALSQEASFTYSGDWLVGGGVQWDWLRANTESDSDGSTPARKYAAVAYFGEAGEKWYLRGQYNIPVPWIFAWQHIFNVKISGLYQPFHWLQLEAELFSDTLERSSGELLDHQYGAGAGVGFRYPASFLWGVEYRLRFLSPVGEAPDTFDHASGDRWTFFVEYTY